MGVRSWVRWLLFLNAYAPLFAIVLLRTWGHEPYLSLILAALIAFPLATALLVLRSAAKLAPFSLSRLIVRDKAADGAAYFGSYVVSFLPGTDPGLRDLGALVILMAVLGAVYVNSGMIHLNPTLSLLGWRIYDVRGVPAGGGSQRRRFVVFSRSDLDSSGEVRIVELSSSVGVAVQ